MKNIIRLFSEITNHVAMKMDVDVGVEYDDVEPYNNFTATIPFFHLSSILPFRISHKINNWVAIITAEINITCNIIMPTQLPIIANNLIVPPPSPSFLVISK